MHKKILFAIIASIATTNAYSDQVLTSRAYVDNADAQKVSIAQGVGTNNANVGKTLVVNSSGNLELGTVSADNFIEDSITDGVTNKAPSENAVHDALENKQDTIATDMVDFVNNMGPLPAITTYDTTSGLVANKIGILDYETIGEGDGEGDLYPYNTDNYGTEMDNYVPTVRAVAEGLTNIWNARLNWSSSLQTPINNYSTTFSDASDTWPGGQRYYVPTAETLANGLALKQNKIPAHAANAADSVLTDSTTAGVVQKRAILDMETFGENFNASDLVDENMDLHNMIPDAGTVGSAIGDVANSKQNKLGGGSSKAGKVVTATATAGNVTYTAIDGTVTNASNNLVTSGAVYTAVSAKQNKMTCTRWLDTPEHPEHTDENCLLWELGN